MNNQKVVEDMMRQYDGQTPAPKGAPYADPKGQSNSPRDANGKRRNPLDADGDGDFDLNDLVLLVKKGFQWVFSWNGFTVACTIGVLVAAHYNINAWATLLGPGRYWTAFAAWMIFQAIETIPILDELNIKTRLESMVRLQRKPVEIPNVSTNVVASYPKHVKGYVRHEDNLGLGMEIARWAAYAVETFVLVFYGGAFGAVGATPFGLVTAILGIVGFEFCLRLACNCQDKLLTKEERHQIKTLMGQRSKSFIKLD